MARFNNPDRRRDGGGADHHRQGHADAGDRVEPDRGQHRAGHGGQRYGDGDGAPGAAQPTGSIRFVLCQPGEGDASGCPSPAGTVVPPNVALSAVAPITATSSATANTFAIGKYCWRARYLGDANYDSANHTNAGAECFTTAKQQPTIATLSNPMGGNVVPGSSVTDTVSVTGGPGQPTPTGTVTWFLCQPGQVTPGQGCVSGGAQIGPVKTLNPFGVKISDATTNTLTVGQYCWRVEYSGDGFYLPSSDTDAGSECFTTVKQPTTPTTASSPTGGNVVPGTSVTDTATITGSAGLPTPTGTVTFFLCQPPAADCAVGGTQVGTPVVLNGSGVATSSAVTGATTPNNLAVGQYCWRAVYSGDSTYNPSTHPGNVAGECFTTVKVNPTVATASSPTGGNVVPGTTVTDTVTVSGGPGQPTPTGTVTWFLCQPNEVTAGGCVTGGTQVPPAKRLNPFGVRISGGASNTLTIGQYCWRVEYTGDGFYNPATHTDALGECFTTVKQPSTPTTASNPTGAAWCRGRR